MFRHKLWSLVVVFVPTSCLSVDLVTARLSSRHRFVLKLLPWKLTVVVYFQLAIQRLENSSMSFSLPNVSAFHEPGRINAPR